MRSSTASVLSDRPARVGSRSSRRTRSPFSQRASCSARSSSTFGSGRLISRIVDLLQTQVGQDPIQGTGQFLAQTVGTSAQVRGDLAPFASLRSLVGQEALLVGQ